MYFDYRAKARLYHEYRSRLSNLVNFGNQDQSMIGSPDPYIYYIIESVHDWIFSLFLYSSIPSPWLMRILLKGVHPIIFLSNIFPNFHLIQKCIHNQQLFQNKDDRMKSLQKDLAILWTIFDKLWQFRTQCTVKASYSHSLLTVSGSKEQQLLETTHFLLAMFTMFHHHLQCTVKSQRLWSIKIKYGGSDIQSQLVTCFGLKHHQRVDFLKRNISNAPCSITVQAYSKTAMFTMFHHHLSSAW